MAFSDAVARMRDHLYARLGVPAVWTPSGGAPIPLTAIPALGDQIGDVQGLSAMITEVAQIRFRVSEVAALAGAAEPLSGDAVTLTLADGDVDYRVSGAASRIGPRRDQFLISLAAA